MNTDAILQYFVDTWYQATDIWDKGGWAMIAIAVIAMVMFSVGLGTWFRLMKTRFTSVPEHKWRRWIDHPVERQGKIGKMISRVTEHREESIQEISMAFDDIRTASLAPFERDIKVMKVCVSAAPLVGLLGTVTGMLTTFSALANGSGGDQTMGMIAGGISEALVTTMTGLVIALPGLFFQYQISRKFEAYRAFLAHLESVCMQRLYRQKRKAQKKAVREAAMKIVAQKLRERVALQGIPSGAPVTE